MNYIAAMLLQQIGDEWLAFLCFAYIMIENKWQELYRDGMKKLVDLIALLEGRLKAEVPLVYSHLKNYDVSFLIVIVVHRLTSLGCFPRFI